VRRHDQVFPAIQPAQIGNGDSLEIDLLPETVVHREEDVEDAAMLQMPPLPQPLTSAPVILSLDAAIPPPPAQDHCDPNCPELLYYWNQYIDEMKLGFVSLPEALDLKAATLHAMQDPAAYPQPYLANKMALYVDGSARGTNAAWSVVAIEYDWRGFPSIMGALSGLIELNHSSPQWIGEAHPDNFSAEITASVAAHIERDAVHGHLVLLSAPQIGCCCPVVRPVVCPGRWLMP
jgi:hypothetical protein